MEQTYTTNQTTHRSTILVILCTSLTIALAMVTMRATADRVPSVLPYSGKLMFNGERVSATGENAPLLKFEVLDGATSTNVAFTQTQRVNVFNGEFMVVLGRPGTNIDIAGAMNEVLTKADALRIQVTVLNDPDNPDDDVVLGNPQRLLMSPYARKITSNTSAFTETNAANLTNLNVANDLTVRETILAGTVTAADIEVSGGLNGDEVVADTLLIGGNPLPRFYVTEPYVESSLANPFVGPPPVGWSAGMTMTPTTNSVCGLTASRYRWGFFGAGIADGSVSGCRIVDLNGMWVLQAKSEVTNTDPEGGAGTNRTCEARCMTY